MTTAHETYLSELARCPTAVVSEKQFRERAARAGWDERTIELFLRPPRIDGAVMVGDEALRVSQT